MPHSENATMTVGGWVLYWACRLYCFFLFGVTLLNVVTMYALYYILPVAPEMGADIALWGQFFYDMGQGTGSLWLFGILAALTGVPYLLDGIFFDRDKRWRLCGLMMYILDALTIGFDIYAYIVNGGFEGWRAVISTLLVRGVSLTLLILPLTAIPLRIARPQDTVVSTDPTVGVVLLAPGLPEALLIDPHAEAEGTRRITIERTSSFIGFSQAVTVACTPSGAGYASEIGSVANGQTVTVVLPVTACTLTLSPGTPGGDAAVIDVPAGDGGRKYAVVLVREGERDVVKVV